MHHVSLDDIQLINLIAKAGNFASAAEQLDLTRPNVTRRVKLLENFLGVTLFKRSTRKMVLTAEGEAFLQHSREIEQHWSSAVDMMRSSHGEPSGRLSVSSPGLVSRILAGPVLSDFASRYPGIELSLKSTWEPPNAQKFDVDLMINIMPLEDKSFISEPISIGIQDFYASPTYLARHGVPAHPSELNNFDLVLHDFPMLYPWRWPGEEQQEYLHPRSRLKFQEIEAAMNMTLNHHGICWLPEFMCDYFVQRGELVRLFEGRFSTEITVWAIYPRTPFVSNRIRLFIDMVRDGTLFGQPVTSASKQ